MARNPQESFEHQNLIKMMATHFTGEGYQNIMADLLGMNTPKLIEGTKQNHIPNLTAQRNSTLIILEAETAGTLNENHTTSQWSLFASVAQQWGGEFHVVVPKGYRDAANHMATSLGISLHQRCGPHNNGRRKGVAKGVMYAQENTSCSTEPRGWLGC